MNKNNLVTNRIHELLDFDLVDTYISKKFIASLNANPNPKHKNNNRLYISKARRNQLMFMHMPHLQKYQPKNIEKETLIYFKQSKRISVLKVLHKTIKKGAK